MRYTVSWPCCWRNVLVLYTPCSVFAEYRVRTRYSGDTPCSLIAYHRVRTRYSGYTPCSFFADDRVRTRYSGYTPCSLFADHRAGTTGSGYTLCMMIAFDCVGTAYECVVFSRQHTSCTSTCVSWHCQYQLRFYFRRVLARYTSCLVRLQQY